jgi:hypothetical protein
MILPEGPECTFDEGIFLYLLFIARLSRSILNPRE